MKQSIKKTNQSTKILEIMHNTEFVNATQTTIFYIQDLFQSTFLTSIQPQITQGRIKSHQISNCLVFLSF